MKRKLFKSDKLGTYAREKGATMTSKVRIEKEKAAIMLDGARHFRYPLDTKDTPYLRYGQAYGSGLYKGIPHPGVDFLGPPGCNVYAVGDGLVQYIRYDPSGYGNYVILRHRLFTMDGSEQFAYTLYAHLADVLVVQGTNVAQGTIIGYQGATGAAGRPHLHFECKRSMDLGLYGKLNYTTLNVWFFDPYTFLDKVWFVVK